MSRPSSVTGRQLTLTEELEKLEQSITLTLQEIDSNFSKAHRIVTTSILPIVEKYGEHSRGVWEGSKFWKHFFEASANVSLSGYEETADADAASADTREAASSYDGAASASHGTDNDDLDSTIADSPTQTKMQQQTTSDANRTATGKAPAPLNTTFAEMPSPYEALRRQMAGPDLNEDNISTKLRSQQTTTPGKRQEQVLPDTSMTPQSSPFAPLPSTTRPTSSHDPLLHRVLDKTYRIQATPHTQRKQRDAHHGVGGASSRRSPTKTTTTRNFALDSSPMSSPTAAPELRSEIFSSPLRRPDNAAGARTPGVSVQTPAAKRQIQNRTHRTPGTAGKGKEVTKTKHAWDSPIHLSSSSDGEDADDSFGLSPPKTMHFVVPANKLLQTPAREASRRIVRDLLVTAGAEDDVDGSSALEGEEDSPSVVRRAVEMDDSF